MTLPSSSKPHGHPAPATAYDWRSWTGEHGEPWEGLLPVEESNVHSLRRIASAYRRDDGVFVASYYWPHSTGNKPGSWSHFKSMAGARRWLERQLAKFWEAPMLAEQRP